MEPAPIRPWAGGHASSRPWVGWMSTKFPLEIPAALGLTVYCPESAAAAAGRSGASGELCRAAEGMGYCGDLCSYVRMGMALAADGGGDRLPRPDFLLCCDNICSGMVQWYQAMARTLDVPLFLINIPYQEGERTLRSSVSYLRAQMEAVAAELEALTDLRWDPEHFAQVCRQANRNVQLWQEILDTALARPAPLGSLEVLDYMPWMVTGRCSRETERQLRDLLAKLREQPSSQENAPRFRIFWEGTPCWPELDQILPMLEQRHIQVVADTISPSLCFRYSDLDGLARAYCGTINGVSLEDGVRMRVELCRRYSVDGVLIHYNRSCRPWCGSLQEVERRLRRELNVPVAAFDGDQGDPSAFSLAQFETRLDTLFDLMTARREHTAG